MQRGPEGDREDEAWQMGEGRRVDEVEHLDKVRVNGKDRGLGKKAVGIRLDNKCEVTGIETPNISCESFFHETLHWIS